MFFAKQALAVMGSSFVLTEQWGFYLLLIMVPFTAFMFVKMNGTVQKQLEQ